LDYEQLMADVVQVVEAIGVVLMVFGGVVSLAQYVVGAARTRDAVGAYDGLRRRLARVILLGLEILLLADIIRTIVVDQTVESVLVLGVIVVIRIVLSFSLQVEIEGTWPWSRWRAGNAGDVTDGRAAPPGSAPR
jgi:uncharacterized membrane protein